MLNLYLVRGVSGAGKSTLVSSLANDADVVVANDDFMLNDRGEYEYDQTRLDEVGHKCRAVTERAMSDKVQRIFVHNTFTKRWEMEPYFALAKQYGYRVFTLVVEHRHDGVDVHNVPDAARQAQKSRFEIEL